MTRLVLVLGLVILATGVASADGRNRKLFSGVLRVQVWTPDKQPLADVPVAYYVGRATDPERTTRTGPKSHALFTRVGPGTYRIKIGLSPTTWSDPVEVTLTPSRMKWIIAFTVDPRTQKVVGTPLVVAP